jgi:hypothetical protein
VIPPENPAAFEAEGKDVVGSGRDVKHALINDRLGLAGIFHGQRGTIEMSLPDGL